MKHISKFTNFLNESSNSLAPEKAKDKMYELIESEDVRGLKSFMEKNNIDPAYENGLLVRVAAKTGKVKSLEFLSEAINDEKVIKARKNLAYKFALENGQKETAKFLLNEYPLRESEVRELKNYIKESVNTSILEKREAEKLLSRF